jgi:riboflavin kinase/FMN adenylyltransferase
MRVIRDAHDCPRPPDGTAVTIGAYDGVHRGHLAVIGELRRLAAERGVATAVVTFDRHPATVVRPESAPKQLTDLDQKLELLDAAGVDHALVVHFDEARSQEPPEAFVEDVLVGCLGAKVVVVGEDFHFGHERRGNVALLREVGGRLGFDVVGLALVDVAGVGRVSSTAIRRALEGGDVAGANELLGRPFELRGALADGVLDVVAEACVPAAGAYAGWLDVGTGAPARPCLADIDDGGVHVHPLDDGDTSANGAARLRFIARIPAHGDLKSDDGAHDQRERDRDAARAVLGVPGPA